MVLEQPQAIPPARQAGPAQEPLHRCGGHGRRALASQVGGDPPAAPRGPRERHAQDPPFPGQGELARPAPAGLMSPGMQSIGPIALEARSPAIEQGAPDPARSCGPWPARSNADTEPRAAARPGRLRRPSRCAAVGAQVARRPPSAVAAFRVTVGSACSVRRSDDDGGPAFAGRAFACLPWPYTDPGLADVDLKPIHSTTE